MNLEAQEARFVALETKVAYQEKLISELNEVLLERGQEVDTLTRRLDNMERIYREGSGADPDPSHDRPPHY
jgi:SlyX protein